MKKEMIMGKILVTVVLLATFSMAGTMKDSRDGQTYKTVKIGQQVWMAKNLNVNVSGSMCYENDPANCEKYGRLYTWEAAMNACPSGWHLPSTEEFGTLLSNVGSSVQERGKNLRAASWWGNSADKFGFSALPAGFYVSYGELFDYLGDHARFWSSHRRASGSVYILGINDGDAHVYNVDKNHGLSVRCLQDSNEEGEASSLHSQAQPTGATLKDSRDGKTYKTVKIGNQVWMAKNLNVNVPGSMCYENDPANCEKYGRLYSWKAAMNACPSGWHLPSKEELETLSGKERGENLRAASWGNRADKFGFSALPAGRYDSDYKEFNYLGIYAYFWSSTEDISSYAYGLSIDDGGAHVYNVNKNHGLSVRCLQDSN